MATTIGIGEMIVETRAPEARTGSLIVPTRGGEIVVRRNENEAVVGDLPSTYLN